jgi:hypothetical protein
MKECVKLIKIISILFALSNKLYAQQDTDLIRMDTVKNCFIAVTTTSFNSGYIKEIDSLLKIKMDTAIIKMRITSTEGSNFKKEYSMLHTKKGSWYYYSGSNEVLVASKTLSITSNEMAIMKPLSVSSMCPGYSATSYEFYFYLLVINGKVIKSYYGNVPVSTIIDIDKKLEADLTLFKKLDTCSSLYSAGK